MAAREYTYTYEEGRIVRAAESDITLSGEIVTGKTVLNTVRYVYDNEGTLTKKIVTPANGTAQTIYYETTDDNTVVKFKAGSQTVTSHSKTDAFGRKVFDELQLGTGFVSRQFIYHAGKESDTHVDKKLLKSSATTQLVSQIVLSDGHTLSYEYDNEESITQVIDSTNEETVVTTYTYDALGQLLTETVNGVAVNTMTYDNYGNITSKNGVPYTYGDSNWRDLLTAYNGQTITYDAQGNPTNYLGHTLFWEKGRQLAELQKPDGTLLEFSYNANGIRTCKAIDGVRHEYALDGTKILCESWEDENGNPQTLMPLYDNEDSVCGIFYNTVPYYFLKNLQGDVVAVVNANAETVAKYTYDAWGVCTVTQDDVGIGAVNPYRYRGYYYDVEMCLYYLQSRYYDPYLGRFINADEAGFIIVQPSFIVNIFTYCENAPCLRVDHEGHSSCIVFRTNPSLYGKYKIAVASYDTDELVFDQRTIDMSFSWGTIAKNGCGPVAVHNAILLAGGESKLSDAVNYLSKRALFFGLFGSAASHLVNYLKKKGYNPKKQKLSSKKSIDTIITDSKNKVGILLYWHSSGGHYIAIKKIGDYFFAYNYRRTKGATVLSSVDSEMKNEKNKTKNIITF